MASVDPEYTKSAVRRASSSVKRGTASPAERDTIGKFRSAHAYPLNAVTMTVRKKALLVNPNAIVAQRLKRLPTILDKIARIPTMSVVTMQDLGGCRVILRDIKEVRTLVEDLRNLRRAQNRVREIYDYIHTNPGPKKDGYRGAHLVFEYGATKERYRGLLIELQVRTQLQHAWATAVETMDLFSGSQLKYGEGNPNTRRFFAIVSSLMAYEEGTALVPGADAPARDLVNELRILELDHSISAKLRNYADIVEDPITTKGSAAFTLELRRSARELTITLYEQMADAKSRLASLEALNDDDLDVVLVNIQQISQLKAAYPNYYADTSMFTDFVSDQIFPVEYSDGGFGR